ncbi:hypothetical protein ACFQ0D_26115, partial [Micromonospora zhanjiangensis]
MTRVRRHRSRLGAREATMGEKQVAPQVDDVRADGGPPADHPTSVDTGSSSEPATTTPPARDDEPTPGAEPAVATTDEPTPADTAQTGATSAED